MKRKIAHILTSSKFSGAEGVAIDIISNLNDDYEYIYISPGGEIENYLKANNIQFIPWKNDSLNEILEKWQPDIIHAHDFTASVKVAFSKYKCLKISHLHQNPKWFNRLSLKSLIYLLATFKINKIIIVSSEILKESPWKTFLDKKTYVIQNIVDKRKVFKSIRQGDETRFDLCYLGRLTKVKDPLRFIKIVSEIKNEINNIQAVIIGNGDLMEACKIKVEELNLSNNITFTGFLENPYMILNQTKILMNTSQREGFGLVAVEAMILGKPVIASNVGGLKSIIDKDSGRLCDDQEEFVNEALSLLKDKELYNKLSLNAIKRSALFTDIDEWINEIRNIYIN